MPNVRGIMASVAVKNGIGTIVGSKPLTVEVTEADRETLSRLLSELRRATIAKIGPKGAIAANGKGRKNGTANGGAPRGKRRRSRTAEWLTKAAIVEFLDEVARDERVPPDVRLGAFRHILESQGATA